MKYLIFFIGSLAVALMIFLALTFSFEPGKTDELDLEKPIVVVVKATVAGQPMNFWSVVQQGINEAAKEFGVEVNITGPDHERQINRQVNILNTVIEENPPLIILAASDYYLLAESVGVAEEKGIPVITMDSAVNSPYPVSFIATNNVEAGIKAGNEMNRLLSEGGDGAIAIVSHIRETATAIEREAGVRQALEKQIITGTWYCENDQKIAYGNTMEILKDTSVKGIVALNEIVTLGVAEAIRDSEASNRVKVVGFDSAPQELAFLEEGIIKATVVQRPYNMGYMSVKTAVEYLKGDNIAPLIDTGSVLITAENMFQREYQELLFPVNDE
ncbi:MAG: LacI family transcriptional regulator [Spirochaetes bacterium]|nr:MAG: LacI family transcriptional regulator [Spirochaetota bacterium]RKX97942.1 MAG: LacI family transcriptional regulator [Spirochaetota bacterium]